MSSAASGIEPVIQQELCASAGWLAPKKAPEEKKPILVRDWDPDAFHLRVLGLETLGYVTRRETYTVTADTNPGTGEVIHLYAIEMLPSLDAGK